MSQARSVTDPRTSLDAGPAAHVAGAPDLTWSLEGAMIPDVFVSLRGRLLVATPALGDPNFDRTVVLILEHTPEGALGMIQ